MAVFIGGKEVDGVRKRYYDACIWCGRELNPGSEYKSEVPFCGEKCQREYEAAHEIGVNRCGAKFENSLIEKERMLEEALDDLRKMHEEEHERLLESDVRLWDGERWVRHILDDTADIEVCNWNRLTGEDWATLLSERAEFADKCKWRKLNNGDMIRLLSNKPQFSSKFERWDSISHDQWVELLNAQPQFGDKCNCWEFFEDDTVSEILHNLKLISRFGDRLTANQFAHLLIEHPQCAKQFDRWPDVDCEHWYELLLYRPKFVDRCDKLNLFSSKQITALCKENPELAQAFSLEGLDREDIVSLLKTKKIVFGDKFLSAQESWFWIELLEADESYAEKCDFSVFSSSDWRVLITDNPRFAKYCDMRKLNGDDLLAIAVKHPQFLGCYRKFALKKTLILIFEFVVLMWPRANNTACVTGSKLFEWFSRIFKSLSCCLFLAGFVVGMGYATWLYNSKISIGIVEVWNSIGNSDLPLKSLILPPICCIVFAYLMVRFDSVRARVHAIVWFVVMQFFLIWVFDVCAGELFAICTALLGYVGAMLMIAHMLLGNNLISFAGTALIYLMLGCGIGYLGSPCMYYSSAGAVIGFGVRLLAVVVIAWRFIRTNRFWYQWCRLRGQWRNTLKYVAVISILCLIRFVLMHYNMSFLFDMR